MKIKCGAQESDCTFILAHHLLSKLAVSSFYKMGSGCKTQQFTCPCQCGEHPSGIYSDTSIGSPEVWHGNVDALMDISIKFVKEKACASDGYENESEIVDLKTDREQIIAQSIVSSFYQKRINPDYTNHMIPSIWISKDISVVYFYDCINDVLLESSEMPYLTAQGDLVKTTIVALWLVLNFKYFCSGLTKGMKESGFKYGFVQIVQEKLKYYDEVTSPCEPRDAMEEEPWTWGPPPEQDEPAEKLEYVNNLGPWKIHNYCS